MVHSVLGGQVARFTASAERVDLVAMLCEPSERDDANESAGER